MKINLPFGSIFRMVKRTDTSDLICITDRFKFEAGCNRVPEDILERQVMTTQFNFMENV